MLISPPEHEAKRILVAGSRWTSQAACCFRTNSHNSQSQSEIIKAVKPTNKAANKIRDGGSLGGSANPMSEFPSLLELKCVFNETQLSLIFWVTHVWLHLLKTAGVTKLPPSSPLFIKPDRATPLLLMKLAGGSWKAAEISTLKTSQSRTPHTASKTDTTRQPHFSCFLAFRRQLKTRQRPRVNGAFPERKARSLRLFSPFIRYFVAYSPWAHKFQWNFKLWHTVQHVWDLCVILMIALIF